MSDHDLRRATLERELQFETRARAVELSLRLPGINEDNVLPVAERVYAFLREVEPRQV